MIRSSSIKMTEHCARKAKGRHRRRTAVDCSPTSLYYRQKHCCLPPLIRYGRHAVNGDSFTKDDKTLSATITLPCQFGRSKESDLITWFCLGHQLIPKPGFADCLSLLSGKNRTQKLEVRLRGVQFESFSFRQRQCPSPPRAGRVSFPVDKGLHVLNNPLDDCTVGLGLFLVDQDLAINTDSPPPPHASDR